MNITYNDTKKDLPADQLYKLFVAVGWSAGTDTPDMIKNYSIPFINSTHVIIPCCKFRPLCRKSSAILAAKGASNPKAYNSRTLNIL